MIICYKNGSSIIKYKYFMFRYDITSFYFIYYFAIIISINILITKIRDITRSNFELGTSKFSKELFT